MSEKRLSIRLSLNDKEFQSGLRKASKKLGSFSKSLRSIGGSMSRTITAPLALAGAGAVKMASDLEESLNKTRVAFGASSASVEHFSKTTLKSFGLSQGSALDMASMFGDMATSMGLTQNQAAEMATQLTGLAGDLASFKNIGVEEAQTALGAVFTGETESLKKLGIITTEAALKQYGYNKSMTQAEKVAIRFKAVLDQTRNAQGDYARTSDGVANSTRTLQESVKELAANIGTQLLPVASKIISALQGVVNKFSGLSSKGKKLVIMVAALTAALGPALFILGSIGPAVSAIGAAFAFLSSPIGIAIGSILAIGTAWVYVSENWDAFKERLSDWGWWRNALIEALQFFIKYNPLSAIVELYNKTVTLLGGEELKADNLFMDLADSLDALKGETKDYETEFGSFADAVKKKAGQAAEALGMLGTSLGVGGGASGPQPIAKKGIGPLKTSGGGGILTASAPVLSGSDNSSMRAWAVDLETFTESYKNAMDKVNEWTTATFGTISQTISQHFANKNMELDNYYQAEKRRIAESRMSEESKAKATEKLDEMVAKRKRALMRKQAKAEKAMAIMSAIVNTASAIAESLPNIPLSIAVGVAGAAQVATIASQPLPALAEGGLAYGPTTALVGDNKGASVDPEVIAPLSKLQQYMGGGTQTVNVVGVIRGEDIYLVNEEQKFKHLRFF